MEPSFSFDPQLAEALNNQIILIKFGGNAMVNNTVKKGVVNDISRLQKIGASPVVVHGGGPVIKDVLGLAKIDSKFVEGHRITTSESMQFIEMALSGKVNGELVSLLNQTGNKAVGLSGKDGMTVTAEKRFHQQENEAIDLGFVGNVKNVNPTLIHTLINHEYVPVISPVSQDENGDTYNINADMFAGHLAGGLNASHYVAMTDVKGILKDKDDPSTLLEKMSLDSAEKEIGGIIKGGMIPKIESCVIALKNGVSSAHIINGTNPHSLLKELISEQSCGTLITR